MIREAKPDEMETVRELFREYAEIVGSPICFESFAREMEELPGQYSPLLLALVSDQPAGCAALRSIRGSRGQRDFQPERRFGTSTSCTT